MTQKQRHTNLGTPCIIFIVIILIVNLIVAIMTMISLVVEACKKIKNKSLIRVSALSIRRKKWALEEQVAREKEEALKVEIEKRDKLGLEQYVNKDKDQDESMFGLAEGEELGKFEISVLEKKIESIEKQQKESNQKNDMKESLKNFQKEFDQKIKKELELQTKNRVSTVIQPNLIRNSFNLKPVNGALQLKK